MKQGVPTRGLETDRECRECGDRDVQRVAETVTPTGRVDSEVYHCGACGASWSEDAPAGLSR